MLPLLAPFRLRCLLLRLFKRINMRQTLSPPLHVSMRGEEMERIISLRRRGREGDFLR